MSKYGQVYETSRTTNQDGDFYPIQRAWRGILHGDRHQEIWRDSPASPDPDTAFDRMVAKAGSDYAASELRRWSGKLSVKELSAL